MEPDAATSRQDELLADLNFAEMSRTVTRAAGGRILEVDGLLLWAGAHPSPALVNGLIRTRGDEPAPEEVLALAERWFGEIGHGYTLHVRVGRDEELEAEALARGFAHVLTLPVMVHHGPPPEPSPADGCTLSTVASPQDLRDFVQAVAEPFEIPDEVRSAFVRPESAMSPVQRDNLQQLQQLRGAAQ